MTSYARSHPELAPERWHLREDHLREVGASMLTAGLGAR